MNTKRLFIALPLPVSLRAKLIGYQEQLESLPVRWVNEDDLHVTMLFLGSTPAEMIPAVIEGMQEVVATIDPPSIRIDRLAVGPSSKRPRMIWAVGSGGEELHDLLSKDLGSRGAYRQSMKRFRTHCTVGRVKRGESLQGSLDVVDEHLGYSFDADSLELKESELSSGGAVHTVMESVPF